MDGVGGGVAEGRETGGVDDVLSTLDSAHALEGALELIEDLFCWGNVAEVHADSATDKAHAADGGDVGGEDVDGDGRAGGGETDGSVAVVREDTEADSISGASQGKSSLTNSEARGLAGRVLLLVGIELGHLELGELAIAEVELSLADDGLHHTHSLHRELTSSSFAREHDAVSTIEDCIGDICGFSTGGGGVVGHGVEHLRGGDHRDTVLHAVADDVLLEAGHLGGADFDSEITTGDHAGIGDSKDIVKNSNGLGLLDLDDDLGVLLVLLDDVAEVDDVLGLADEGEGEEIDIEVVEDEVGIINILLCESGHGAEVGLRKVHTLVVLHLTTLFNTADKLVGFALIDTEAEETIINKDGLTNLAVCDHLGEFCRNNTRLAGLIGCNNRNLLTSLDCNRTTRESIGTDLGSLEIGNDSDFSTKLFCNTANCCIDLLVEFVITVREIHSNYINTSRNDIGDCFLCLGSGAQGCNNLGEKNIISCRGNSTVLIVRGELLFV